MRRYLVALALSCFIAPAALAQSFTLEQVRGYPYPTDLVAAPAGASAAWVLNEHGVRNIWEAQVPDSTPRQLTSYTQDDGQELTQLAFTADGRTIVYVRGGDHGANWPAEGNLAPDPASNPIQPKVGIWAVAVTGGTPRLLAEGDDPEVNPRDNRVALIRGGQVFVVAIDSSRATDSNDSVEAGRRQPGSRSGAPGPRAIQLFFTRGTNGSLAWSPDGSRLAFVSNRGDHAFVGIFTSDSEPIRYLAPSTARDLAPRWSPDGRRIAFVRMPGQGGPPRSLLQLEPNPWAIWVADAATGEGHEVWRSPNTLRGSYPTSLGQANLSWGAGDRLVFTADVDNWPHLYSVSASGGEALLLTPGEFMVEFVATTPDHRSIVYSANAGRDANDDDRRHLFRVSVDRAGPTALTSGGGLEWAPVVMVDGTIGLISAEARRPPLVAVLPASGGAPKLLGADRIPADFPTDALVVPRKVVFRSPDGLDIHGQLFERPGLTGKHPAVVFVHGGPPRQMLLGWHYSYYYANSYAVNQYLASRSYVVLSVNYRLGIGYGHDFHHPPHGGAAGAAEYQDVLAGGRYLAALPEVDAHHIGIWGGSYGGFLTAMALAKNSDVFAAGSDLHGVHDWTDGRFNPQWRYEAGDLDSARTVAWQSSPVAYVGAWKSPVILIQGDDDRNVRFHQTVDLARRLAAAGVHYEELVIPDEIHDFLRHRSWLVADSATAAFFDKTFGVH